MTSTVRSPLVRREALADSIRSSLVSMVPLSRVVLTRFTNSCCFSDQAVKLGTFDEKNCGRDRMPDNAAVQLARAILVTPVLRTAGAFWFYYSKADSPINAFGWSLPLRMGAYMLVIDYFFYAYHRSTHECELLPDKCKARLLTLIYGSRLPLVHPPTPPHHQAPFAHPLNHVCLVPLSFGHSLESAR